MNDKENVKTLSQLAMLGEEGEGAEQEFHRLLCFLELPQAEVRDGTFARETVSLREDCPKESLSSEGLLSLAPCLTDNYVSVPKALEDSEA